MKLHTLPTLLLATGLLFAAPVLQAEGDKPAGPKPEANATGKPSPEAQKKREEMRKKFDTNGDGKLDDTERQAFREAMKNNPEFQKKREEMQKKFDTNGDGTLDETEKAAAEAAMKSRTGDLKGKAMARFDTNGDGTLDETEKAAAKKEMEAKKGQGTKPPGS